MRSPPNCASVSPRTTCSCSTCLPAPVRARRPPSWPPSTRCDEFNIAVIEGDIDSSVDAEKIKAQGIAAVQINTGGACHLESAMIKRAVDVLDLERLDLIIVENVGNLVCPTDFDLGENAKVMILSVPEGDDKPLKYPGVFQVAEAVVLNKVDTMPVFNFDREAFEAAVTQLNPQAPIFPIAATKGDGVDARAEWRTAFAPFSSDGLSAVGTKSTLRSANAPDLAPFPLSLTCESTLP